MTSLNHHESTELITGPFGSEARKFHLKTDELLLTAPDSARKILGAYKAAGSKVAFAPSWAANARGIEDTGFTKRHRDWNHRAVDYVEEIFAGHPIYASIAPLLDTSGGDDQHWTASFANTAQKRHAPQLEALREKNVTRIAGEAFRYPKEASAVAQEFAKLGGKEFVCSFETRDGLLPYDKEYSFETVRDFLIEETRGQLKIGVGLNCSSVKDCEMALRREKPGTFSAVYPNKAKISSDPRTTRYLELEHLGVRNDREQEEYTELQRALDHSPQELQRLIVLAKELRIPLVGICCGGTPKDVELLAKSV